MKDAFVDVIRGETLESRHRVHVAFSTADGVLAQHAGDPAFVAFTRSALKPFQMLPLLESGAADEYGFTSDELAVIAASHNGEPVHVAAVRSILEKAGVPESALGCGAHAPYHAPSASALTEPILAVHNNCSGKHAGFLAQAKFLGAPLASYLSPEHPVQKRIEEIVTELSGARAHVGIDGCSAPNYAVPVVNAARLFGALARPDGIGGKTGKALARVSDAMRANPYHVAGAGRFDTRLMEASDPRLASKSGAEACVGVADTETGLGMFLKVEDGSSRAVAPAAIEAMRQAAWLEGRAFEVLGEDWRPALKNHAGAVVGRIEPSFGLHVPS